MGNSDTFCWITKYGHALQYGMMCMEMKKKITNEWTHRCYTDLHIPNIRNNM